MRQTVFTPTYNRAKLLPRLYKSLLAQTFKDFTWLIVDDGSSDNTPEVVKQFQDEKLLSIKYVQKPNGGKHTAQWMAYQVATTPYITEIDSDDTLMPDAVENFENAWIDIEANGTTDIAKVSMFATYPQGGIVGTGNFTLDNSTHKTDATWQELVLKRHCHRELVSSLCRSKFLECYNVDNYAWHRGSFLDESIIWSAVGRKYKTRLLNKVGRTVFTDADNSILRQEFAAGREIVGGGKLLTISANQLYFIDQNIDYFWYNPRYFLGRYRLLIKSASKSIKAKEVARHFNRKSAKLLFYILNIPFRII